jgi:hypothetical protein
MIIWIKSSVKHKLPLIPLKYLAKSVACNFYFIIIVIIFHVCILHVEDFPLGKKTKCCSLIMNQTRPFEIPNVVVFSLKLLKDISCQGIRSNC